MSLENHAMVKYMSCMQQSMCLFSLVICGFMSGPAGTILTSRDNVAEDQALWEKKSQDVIVDPCRECQHEHKQSVSNDIATADALYYSVPGVLNSQKMTG
jgi:hypothetical protein